MDVDIVVLWVDGNDPNWQQEKKQYCSHVIDDSNSNNRFRDWGLMKYWFRSIEKFAPWVRKVHFVTWGHFPSFLNLNHPKLNIVRHEDYMPEGTLPTFNANALEMNLFRIEGLADHFIFFNDDMFLLKPMSMQMFFSPSGYPCSQFGEIPIMFKGNPEVWQMLAANDVGIINKYFNKRKVQNKHMSKFFNLQYDWYDNLRSLILREMFPNIFTGFKNFHAPAAFLKSTFSEIWEKEPVLLSETSSHKFRSNKDVNQWLAIWWQMAEGRFSPCKMKTRVYNANEQHVRTICEDIKEQNYDMICINDPNEVKDFENISSYIQDSFKKILPYKSMYEI